MLSIVISMLLTVILHIKRRSSELLYNLCDSEQSELKDHVVIL